MSEERNRALATATGREHPAHIANRINLAYKLIRYCQRAGIDPVDMVAWTDDDWVPHIEAARLKKRPSGATLRAVLQISAPSQTLA